MNRPLLLLLCLLACVIACRNPLDGVELRLRKAYPPVLALEFVPRAGNLPANVEIQLRGPNANLFVTTLYSKRFRLTDDGYLYLALDSMARPSLTAPLWVTVVARAEGFLDVVRLVQVTKRDTRFLTCEMIPASDQSVTQQSGTANATGGVSSVIVAQMLAKSDVQVAKGTTVYDVVGKAVTGNLTLRFEPLDVSNRSKAVAALGLSTSDGVLPLADQTGPKQRILSVVGAATLDLFSETYEVVKSLSQPVELVFRLGSTAYNPIARRLIQKGDQIPIFSYDPATERWQQEAMGRVGVYDEGILGCFSSTTHLSLHTAAFTTYTCPQAVSFRVQTDVPASNREYRCELINAVDGAVLRTFTTTITDGKLIQIADLVSDGIFALKVYDNQSMAVALSPVVTGCGTAQPQPVALDMTAFKTPVPKEYCSQPVNFKIQTSVPPSDRPYRCELIGAADGAVMRTFTTTIADGKLVQVADLERGWAVKLKVYDNQSGAIATSIAVNNCGNDQNQPISLDLTAFKTPAPAVPTTVTISLQFPCKVIDAEKLPTKELYARFRLTGTTKWKLLPVLKYEPGRTAFSVEVSTAELTPGNTYDLEAGAAIGYYTFSQPAYKLDDYNLVIKIKTKEFCKE